MPSLNLLGLAPNHFLALDVIMTKTKFRVIKNSEWREYRNIRLAALKEAPDAFGSTFESAREYPDQEWEKRCAFLDIQTDYPLVAIIDGIFVGIVWSKISQPEKTICHIYQMWVKPEYRGLNLGRKLLIDSISWAQSKNVESIQLSVTCGNSPAQKLYESLGFIATGDSEPIRKGSKLMAQPMEFLPSNVCI